METYVFPLVLLAAIAHASWNALLKKSKSGFLTVAVIGACGCFIGLIGAAFLPYPGPEVWPYLITSVAIHVGYQIFLILAYRIGDLSLVYPIARGSAPMLVALFSALWAKEHLSSLGLVGVLLVSVGLGALTFVRKSNQELQQKPIVYALLVSLFIAGYSVVDGIGARVSGNSLSYIAWLFIMQSWPIAIIAYHQERGGVREHLKRFWKSDITAGIIGSIGYAIIIWAMSFNKMAYVSALRETSVIFAVLIGSFMFHEPLGHKRLMCALVVTLGIILIRF